ncbi:quinoprotein relay system zinc metallohydrolase 2 [Tabrizicola aquatica]|uniref:quinoprotein relay system zinc metallohydrolase 2 n=1 Tax=Tabrizicola aquatica TaxID=909926 RepID=UPI000CD22135|nr:quinoprotein relay system zinc metallohydrolase 2 [Tabrizicola aquatica]
MYHLVVTACLVTAPTVCADRLLPTPEPLAETDCTNGASARIAAWADLHPDLVIGSWTCRPTGNLPALDLAEIAPGVLAHAGQAQPLSAANGGDIANLGVVIGDTVAVIDPGGSRAIGERLYAAIRQITDQPISHVILTHMHPDHIFGAEVFSEAGATIIAHHNLPSALDRRAGTWAESIPRQTGALAMLGTRAIPPDITLAARQEITLGGATLRLDPVATAHTDNDLTVLHLESGTLFTGDLVFAGLTPSLDGSLTGWLAWLSQPPDPPPQRIVPGHGPVSLPWDQGTAPLRAYLAALADQTRAAIIAGEAMSEAATHVGTDQRGDWQGFDEINARNAIAAFKELEWE